MTTMFEVLEGGIQTTVQDFPGRQGLLDQGICPAGPFDSVAHRLANLLAGNDAGAAGLEITAGNFQATFHDDAVIALCGANMQPKLDGAPMSMWTSHRVRKGQTLALSSVEGGGFRSYLAVAGAIDVPEYLGSKSTYVPGGIGGFQGRPLKKGDQIPVGQPRHADHVQRKMRQDQIPVYTTEWVVEAGPGPQAAPDYWTWEDFDFFFSNTWKLDRNSNRMGYRMQSHQWQWARTSGGVAGGHPSNILDNGYAVGAVNIAGDQPIILGVDGPTLGGFVCAVGVAYGAMWKLGQMAPGRDTIRFKELTIEQAADLARATALWASEKSLDRG
ncbi:MAG: 5-oxoprolinase/urea amidolyase family protein [Thermomicrobiales bacterium]